MANEDVLNLLVDIPVKLSLIAPILWGIADAAQTADLTATLEFDDPEVLVIKVRHG